MKRLLISLPLLLGALMLRPSVLSACECICKKYGDGSPIAMKQHAAVVFVGEVVNVEVSAGEKGFVGVLVNFRVERYWKGVKKQEITVRMDWACCSMPSPKVGEEFLLYAVGRKRETTCTRTRKLDLADEDLRALGPGKIVRQSNAGAKTGSSDQSQIKAPNGSERFDDSGLMFFYR